MQKAYIADNNTVKEDFIKDTENLQGNIEYQEIEEEIVQDIEFQEASYNGTPFEIVE